MSELVHAVTSVAFAVEEQNYGRPSRKWYDRAYATGLVSDQTPYPAAFRAVPVRDDEWEWFGVGGRVTGDHNRKLEKALGSYQYRVYFNPIGTNHSQDSATLQIVPADWKAEPMMRDRKNWPSSRSFRDSSDEVQEAWMVLRLTEIAKSSSELQRLKMCKCGRWFYANRKDKKYHSENCRKKFHVPGANQLKLRRKYNREYQRDYRKGIHRRSPE
jgi:hypothetical protein